MGKTYNEALTESGEVRKHYGPLFEALERLGAEGFVARREQAAMGLREMGATFPLPGDDPDRVLPADWVPRIVPKRHWERLSAGLLQRGRAINLWLEDLPESDVVPETVLKSSVFGPPANSFPKGSFPVRVYGPDVVHLGGGEYVVLEDNVRMPSGVAYAEAVRAAGQAAFAEAYGTCGVGEIAPYYAALRDTLRDAAPPGEEPRVAVLTGGPGDPAFFEHQRIAQACGVHLLGPADAPVRGGVIVAGPGAREEVNVVYRRFDEDLLDESFPGLRELCVEGKVRMVNPPDVGIADDKGVFPYVPDMIRNYLGEEPILKNARTLSLAEPEDRAAALRDLGELVLKPREGYGGKGVLIGPEASRKELKEAGREVEEDPLGFIVQETLDFSTHVLDEVFGRNGAALGDETAEAFVDLRTFVLPAAGYVMPGGLTRMAKPGTRVVNSSAGGSFKDTWVLQG